MLEEKKNILLLKLRHTLSQFSFSYKELNIWASGSLPNALRKEEQNAVIQILNIQLHDPVTKSFFILKVSLLPGIYAQMQFGVLKNIISLT